MSEQGGFCSLERVLQAKNQRSSPHLGRDPILAGSFAEIRSFEEIQVLLQGHTFEPHEALFNRARHVETCRDKPDRDPGPRQGTLDLARKPVRNTRQAARRGVIQGVPMHSASTLANWDRGPRRLRPF